MMTGTKFVNLSSHHKLKTKQQNQVPIVDLRTPDLYKLSHLVDSANIPVEELNARLYELPMSSQPISLFGSSVELQNAKEYLSGKGYKIESELVTTDNVLSELNDKGLSEVGSQYNRIWQPAAIVDTFIQNFSKTCTNKKGLDLACGSGRDTVYMAMKVGL